MVAYSTDLRFHVLILVDSCWRKNDYFFKSQSLRIVPSWKRNVDPSYWRETVLLKFIADKYKTQEICEKAVKGKDWKLRFVPDSLETQKYVAKT